MPLILVSVDTLLTVGTARWVPRVDNTDGRHTAADRQHWTGVKPLKHRLSSLLSDLTFTVNVALQQIPRDTSMTLQLLEIGLKHIHVL